MEPSEEIRRVVDRWVTALSNALGGEVLVSDLVHTFVGGDGTGPAFRGSRDVEAKGLEGTHRLLALDPG